VIPAGGSATRGGGRRAVAGGSTESAAGVEGARGRRGRCHAAGLWIRPEALVEGGPAKGRCLPGAAALHRGLPVAVPALEAAAGGSALLHVPWAGAAAPAWPRLRGGDLPGAAAPLAGLGPGLTPSGDDALAGILVLARALLGEPWEAPLRGLVDSLPVGPASRSMLRWAAQGQSLHAVHDLLDAAARGDHAAARVAARETASVGASSGADLCLGMAYMGRSAIQTASAGSVEGLRQVWGRSVRKWSASPGPSR
jgi:Protein of unknown function (DUF2877)